MAGPQFVYVMKGLSKTYPGGKQVLKDIWLSFYPGAKIGIVGDKRAARRLHRRARFGQIAAGHTDDRRAFLCEGRTNRLTNAPARAGDHHHFVFEFHKIVNRRDELHESRSEMGLAELVPPKMLTANPLV